MKNLLLLLGKYFGDSRQRNNTNSERNRQTDSYCCCWGKRESISRETFRACYQSQARLRVGRYSSKPAAKPTDFTTYYVFYVSWNIRQLLFGQSCLAENKNKFRNNLLDFLWLGCETSSLPHLRVRTAVPNRHSLFRRGNLFKRINSFSKRYKSQIVVLGIWDPAAIM